jgi:hypothetical protein
MKKRTIKLQVNIPAEFLTTANLYNEFVTVESTVSTQDDSWLVLIDKMTFRGCMAFNIKAEMQAKFIDMIEDLAIQDYIHIRENMDCEYYLHTYND